MKPVIRVPAGRRVQASVASQANGIAATVGPEGLEAGRMRRRLSSFLPARAHINSLLARSGPTLKARARYLVRNNGYANNAAHCFATATIGAGIVPSWRGAGKNKALKKQ